MAKYDTKTKDDKCVFCEIVNGTLSTPGIFWENEKFMAFLSLWPNCKGNTVLIPKKHYPSDVLSMPENELKDFIIATKEVSNILENFFDDVGRVGVVMEGTGIDHAHIKLYPMHGTSHLKKGEWKQHLSNIEVYFEEYEGYISSNDGPKANEEDIRELAGKLKK